MTDSAWQDFQESKAALEEQYAQLSDEKEALGSDEAGDGKKKQQVASQQKAAVPSSAVTMI